MSALQKPLIWVLTDDRPGNATQALGVAEALGMPFAEKRLVYDGLARLPNLLRGATLVGLAGQSRAALAQPWPDLVISAGRRTAPVARWIKRQTEGRARLAHIMNPGKAGAGDFDLIAIPRHDCKVPGGDAPNVLRVTGAPHRLSPARRAKEATVWGPRLGDLPRPYIAVLVGGATRQRPFPPERATDLGRQVSAMVRELGGSVLLATSRRTGGDAEAALDAAVDVPRTAYFWGRGPGENPYFGYLALADGVVVTGDSVSMCSEACATPGPVFIYAPDGMVAGKHSKLHNVLYSLKLAAPFDGRWSIWTHPPLNAANDVAAAVRRLDPIFSN